MNLHRLVTGEYLKELFNIHEKKGTIDISIYELKTLCNNCRFPDLCKKCNKIDELTCFCLESVF